MVSMNIMITKTAKTAADKIVKVTIEDGRVPEIIEVEESIAKGCYPRPRPFHRKTRIITVLEDPTTIANEGDCIGVLGGTGVGAIRVRSMEAIVRRIIMQGIMDMIHDPIITIIITTTIGIRCMTGRDDTYPLLVW